MPGLLLADPADGAKPNSLEFGCSPSDPSSGEFGYGALLATPSQALLAVFGPAL